ncbi:iron ABC transporter ATP-binding protein FetA [Marinobacterium zhoushanense]|uniref:Iron ABC transporter ATP-binding protein FetA n=1 Tax=Marinobacterium zhoushanense TaxID=1679163 RepID=A0ABQ1KNA6_9GAMM|nr:ATP-binding cassette domain-containing protein [Marinobacterium zhoushanense]GGC02330.1 iron ABC transporter ATP-binding protein FetA [Marinobacterium zhoushanense]
MTDAAVIELRGFAISRNDTLLLEPTDMVIATGERLLITGPSGCGKSTFLKRLCALEPGNEEQVWLRGEQAARWEMPKLRKTMAYLPQTPVMLEGSVRDNLCLGLSLRVYKGMQFSDDRLRDALASVNLDIDLESNATRLSPGQKARVALLQRLMLTPDVLLCDEPIASLDQENAQLVVRVLAEAGAAGMTQIIVSHQGLPDLYGRQYRLNQARLELVE